MKNSKRQSAGIWGRILFLAFLILSIGVILFFALNRILPGFWSVLEHGDQEEIIAYIRSFGSTGSILLAFLLQFFQILSIFFPGGPIQIAVGIVFGTLTGFLICHAGYVLANAFVFFSVRKLGNRLGFANGKSASKLQFIADSKHPGFMVVMACLMPFLPNGLVPYIAAKTKLTFGDFFISVYFGSIPCLLLLCAIGSKLLTGHYTAVIILSALFVGMIVVLLLFRNAIFAFSERIRAFLEKKLNPSQSDGRQTEK